MEMNKIPVLGLCAGEITEDGSEQNLQCVFYPMISVVADIKVENGQPSVRVRVENAIEATEELEDKVEEEAESNG